MAATQVCSTRAPSQPCSPSSGSATDTMGRRSGAPRRRRKSHGDDSTITASPSTTTTTTPDDTEATVAQGGGGCSRNDGLGEDWVKGEVLGRGAYGVVYRGCLANGGSVAVKQIHTDGMTESELRSVENEILMMRSLRHPNVVMYLGVEQVDHHLNIFLEYVDGGSLRKLLQSHGAMKEPKAANMTRQLCEGLAYLHSRGITHRDIKSANVLVRKDSILKLADFGASKRTGHESVLSGLKGTPQWMAPEVIRGQQTSEGWCKADVWSLGCTLVEMLTGRMPWPDIPNPMAAMYRIANGEQPPVDCEIGSAAEDFIKNCCKANPAQRPSTEKLLSHPFLGGMGGWPDSGGVTRSPGAGAAVDWTEQRLAARAAVVAAESCDASQSEQVYRPKLELDTSFFASESLGEGERFSSAAESSGRGSGGLSIKQSPYSCKREEVMDHLGLLGARPRIRRGGAHESPSNLANRAQMYPGSRESSSSAASGGVPSLVSPRLASRQSAGRDSRAGQRRQRSVTMPDGASPSPRPWHDSMQHQRPQRERTHGGWSGGKDEEDEDLAIIRHLQQVSGIELPLEDLGLLGSSQDELQDFHDRSMPPSTDESLEDSTDWNARNAGVREKRYDGAGVRRGSGHSLPTEESEQRRRMYSDSGVQGQRKSRAGSFCSNNSSAFNSGGSSTRSSAHRHSGFKSSPGGPSNSLRSIATYLLEGEGSPPVLSRHSHSFHGLASASPSSTTESARPSFPSRQQQRKRESRSWRLNGPSRSHDVMSRSDVHKALLRQNSGNASMSSMPKLLPPRSPTSLDSASPHSAVSFSSGGGLGGDGQLLTPSSKKLGSSSSHSGYGLDSSHHIIHAAREAQVQAYSSDVNAERPTDPMTGEYIKLERHRVRSLDFNVPALPGRVARASSAGFQGSPKLPPLEGGRHESVPLRKIASAPAKPSPHYAKHSSPSRASLGSVKIRKSQWTLDPLPLKSSSSSRNLTYDELKGLRRDAAKHLRNHDPRSSI